MDARDKHCTDVVHSGQCMIDLCEVPGAGTDDTGRLRQNSGMDDAGHVREMADSTLEGRLVTHAKHNKPAKPPSLQEYPAQISAQ